jgi:hypothetical protein
VDGRDKPGHDGARVSTPNSSCPALCRASTSLPRDRFEKIVPSRIGSDNFPDLPRAGPVLDVVLALDRVADIVELLEINQPLQSVSFGESFDESRAVFVDAANEIARHADIQNAVRTIGQNVNPSTCHVEIPQDVDGRDKPGHDAER